MIPDLTPAQIARADQELAVVDRVCTDLVRQFPDFLADQDRIVRIGALITDLRAQTDDDPVRLAGLLAVAIERLAKWA